MLLKKKNNLFRSSRDLACVRPGQEWRGEDRSGMKDCGFIREQLLSAFSVRFFRELSLSSMQKIYELHEEMRKIPEIVLFEMKIYF